MTDNVISNKKALFSMQKFLNSQKAFISELFFAVDFFYLCF